MPASVVPSASTRSAIRTFRFLDLGGQFGDAVKPAAGQFGADPARRSRVVAKLPRRTAVRSGGGPWRGSHGTARATRRGHGWPARCARPTANRTGGRAPSRAAIRAIATAPSQSVLPDPGRAERSRDSSATAGPPRRLRVPARTSRQATPPPKLPDPSIPTSDAECAASRSSTRSKPTSVLGTSVVSTYRPSWSMTATASMSLCVSIPAIITLSNPDRLTATGAGPGGSRMHLTADPPTLLPSVERTKNRRRLRRAVTDKPGLERGPAARGRASPGTPRSASPGGETRTIPSGARGVSIFVVARAR